MQTKQHFFNANLSQPSATTWRALGQLVLAGAIVVPGLALAQTVGDGTGVVNTTCEFLTRVQTLLNAISIVVVTIAIIFSGYQIAFAHKRISDVAPVFIGAILIGAASQIAKMFLPTTGSCSTSTTSSIAPDGLHQLASMAHALAGYLV